MTATNTAVEQAPAMAEPPVPLIFTDSAAAKVADLIAEEGNPELNFVYSFKAVDVPDFSMGLLLMMPLMRMTPALKKMG